MIVAVHHLVGNAVNRILNPAFFRVDEDADVLLVGPLAEGSYPLPDAGESGLIGLAQLITFLNGFEQFSFSNARYFKHRKRNVLRFSRPFDGAKNFEDGVVEALFVFLAFHRIIEDGANLRVVQVLDRLLTVADGFAAAELLEDGVPDKAFDGQTQVQGQFYEKSPYFYEPSLVHQRK